MRVEAGRGGEALVVDVAYVRLLPRVGPRVPLQEARPVKALPAHLKNSYSIIPGGYFNNCANLGSISDKI